ncbi:MAG: DUF2214 family protein [Rhizobiaceae bacterium]|nr:DUF2214 family protein [Rhizobiaceae bacterium]MCV0405014.1 DUF2214 family protein [Rhizobiaceae bacterium]
MFADTLLAILHHIFAFSLMAMLAAELVLVRPGLTGEALRRVAGLDRGYGLAALLVFAVGIMRLIWGAKGWEYYASNPWFWIKMALFVVVGALSIKPTMRFMRWQKSMKADNGFSVPAAELAGARRLIHTQIGLFILIPVAAALMARY